MRAKTQINRLTTAVRDGSIDSVKQKLPVSHLPAGARHGYFQRAFAAGRGILPAVFL